MLTPFTYSRRHRALKPVALLVLSPTFLSCLLSFLIITSPVIIRAQQDSTQTAPETQQEKDLKKARHKAIYGDARKATIMSACLPGLGQAYNKKYWKVPIIYVALGGLTYSMISNQNKYKYYSTNLKYEADGDPSTINTTLYNQDQLVLLKKTYKKYRDYSIIGVVLIYVLNVIDANVDAHLKTFDVSNDLSLKISPYSNFSYNKNINTGITFQFTFK